MKGKLLASTSVAVHTEGCKIEFRYAGKDQIHENFAIEIGEGEGDAYSVQDVCFFIGPDQRKAVAAGLRKLATAISRKAEA